MSATQGGHMEDTRNALILLVFDAIRIMQGMEEVTPLSYADTGKRPCSTRVALQISRINNAIEAAREFGVLPSEVPRLSKAEQVYLRKTVLRLHKLEMTGSIAERVLEDLAARGVPTDIITAVEGALDRSSTPVE